MSFLSAHDPLRLRKWHNVFRSANVAVLNQFPYEIEVGLPIGSGQATDIQMSEDGTVWEFHHDDAGAANTRDFVTFTVPPRTYYRINRNATVRELF